jgi:hypothetical protein
MGLATTMWKERSPSPSDRGHWAASLSRDSGEAQDVEASPRRTGDVF